MTAEEAMARISELMGGYYAGELTKGFLVEQVAHVVGEWEASR